MANYTKSRIVTDKAAGSYGSGTVGVMTLTPKSGYVVKALDFSVAGISGFQFALADTSTAYAIGNTVTITVSYDGFTVPTNDVTLTLAITGDAILFEPTITVKCSLRIDEDEEFHANSLDINGHTSEATGFTCTSFDSGTATIIGGSHTITSSQLAGRDYILAASFNVITSNTESSTDGTTAIARKLNSIVGLRMTDGSDSYKFKIKSITEETNSSSVNFGTSTAQIVEVYRKVNDPHTETKFAEVVTDKIEVSNSDRAITVVPPAINKTIDLFDTDGPFTVAIGGETRNFKIYGDVGAGATLFVRSSSPDTSLSLLNEAFTIPPTNVVNSSGALVNSNRVRGKGIFEKTIDFPVSGANKEFDVEVRSAASGTTIVGDQVHTFSQSIDPKITITCDKPTNIAGTSTATTFRFSQNGSTFTTSGVASDFFGVAKRTGRQLVNLKEKSSRITYSQIFICGDGSGGTGTLTLHTAGGNKGAQGATDSGRRFSVQLTSNIRNKPKFSSTSDASANSSFDNSNSPGGNILELVDFKYTCFSLLDGAWTVIPAASAASDDTGLSAGPAVNRIDVTCTFNIRQYGTADATMTLKTDRLFLEQTD
jgi:hypothetical protein